MTDARRAYEVLRPVYDATDSTDGFVSLEVSPHLARNAAVDRPNVMIKIPGTLEGLPVIEELLCEGINVNITLLFAVERYVAVADAYLRALERGLAAGQRLGAIASVASFFLSRMDTLVDQLLAHRTTPDGSSKCEPHPKTLQRQIASAKLAYRSFIKLLASKRWQRLAEQGARSQRLLWASTSTKNPAYGDLMYVGPLIGPQTVNTMTEATIAAFADHGLVRDSVRKGFREAARNVRALKSLNINLKQITDQLENEGIEKFIRPYDKLLDALETARERAARRETGDLAPLADAAAELRRDVIRMTTAAGSGHPTSCMSDAEIMAALFFRVMRWDPSAPDAHDVDTYILSKGHAAPVLWAALKAAGAIDEDLATLRQVDSTLEGHPTPNNPWVRVAPGSLGQGLAAANRITLANHLDGIDARVYCLLGDGECSEGSVREVAQFASLQKLANVVAIVDENGFGQSEAAAYDHDTGVVAARFRAFGWNAIESDGHDLGQVLGALTEAAEDGPTAIIARTVKGKGVSFLAGKDGWHGKALDREEKERALAELPEPQSEPQVEPRRVGRAERPARRPSDALQVDYSRGDKFATRDAFGPALRKLGELNPDGVALDGDVKDSTRTSAFAKAFPDRFFESYIAEQNRVGAALGLAADAAVHVVRRDLERLHAPGPLPASDEASGDVPRRRSHRRTPNAPATMTAITNPSVASVAGDGSRNAASKRSEKRLTAAMPGAMPSRVPTMKSRSRMCEAPATRLTTVNGATGMMRTAITANTPRLARRRDRAFRRAPARRRTASRPRE